MPLQATSGAASQDAFGGNGVAVVPTYIEDVFSTYLYTGNGSTQTITNNIDLSTEGGLVWIKSRSGSFNHKLTDTARGATKELVSNAVTIEATVANALTAFNSTGFVLGSDIYYNNNTSTYASWTFRKQPKFFDVVTYTGNGVSGRAIPHNLGSAPGCVIIKAINQPENWVVWHRSGSQDNTYGAYLNTTATYSNKAIDLWGSSPGTPDMNATTFSVGGTTINIGGGSPYVAYIFAHDAGGFGLTGTDNVISCGSFTGGTWPLDVNLGYEPQYVMIKSASSASSWWMFDNMRGLSQTDANAFRAETSGAEQALGGNYVGITSTGFQLKTSAGGLGLGTTNIYIAIRRGPMKVPTDGTSVFAPILQSNANTPPRTISGAGFAPDLMLQGTYQYANGASAYDRLRGQVTLLPPYTNAEASAVSTGASFTMDGISYTGTGTINNNGNAVDWFFRRAPSFFDEVCYTGTGSATTFSHNLAAVPELMIVKRRSTAFSWTVYSASLAVTEIMVLNTTAAIQVGSDAWNSTRPTASVFSVSPGANSTNASGSTYVAYLFATCAGVSKVGSYTGNGSTQTINCGFGAGGARFVLIKRTDATGDWYVYDTARGMTVLTNPYLLMNSASTGAATLGSVTTVSTGFALDSAILADINVNAGTYIFLAIA